MMKLKNKLRKKDNRRKLLLNKLMMRLPQSINIHGWRFLMMGLGSGFHLIQSQIE